MLLQRLAPLVALALLAAPALATHSVSRSYEISTVNPRTGVADPTATTSDGMVDVGGVVFPPADFANATIVDVVIADFQSPRTRGLLCQDLDADVICGEAGEPRIEFCDNLAPGNILLTHGVPLSPTVALTVFVFAGPVRVSAANPGSSGYAPCPDGADNFGTTGTVTVLLNP